MPDPKQDPDPKKDHFGFLALISSLQQRAEQLVQKRHPRPEELQSEKSFINPSVSLLY